MKKIAIPDSKGILLFKPEEIICFKGTGAYTNIFVVNPKSKTGWRQLMASRHLGYFEKKLTRLHFQRISKSMIIGLEHITAINKDSTISLGFPCCQNITVSQNFKKKLEQKLHIILTLAIHLLSNADEILLFT